MFPKMPIKNFWILHAELLLIVVFLSSTFRSIDIERSDCRSSLAWAFQAVVPQIPTIPKRNKGHRLVFQKPDSIRWYMSTEDAEFETSTSSLKLDNLIDMDVVIYSLRDDDDDNDEIATESSSSSPKSTKYYLGAMQEDGILSPLSTWTTEPAFGTSIEFLVDEEDRFQLKDKQKQNDRIQLRHLLTEDEVTYGSRQCHRGVGNPHGEESELLYYIEQRVIEQYKIEIMIKPELEILW